MDEMDNLWEQLLKMEKEEQNRSKREPSLRTPEEGVTSEKEEGLWKSPVSRGEAPAKSPEEVPDHEVEFNPPLTLVANLAKRIRKRMVEIRDLTESTQGRFKDSAFSREFHQKMTELIDHSEADLDCFLDYLRIKSPVPQTNMIHVILEEALERHKKKLLDKGIRVFKKQFEKVLPNAGVHIDELRFILNWILEYAILSAAPNQSIALLTRSLEVQERHEAIRSPEKRGTGSIEIVVASGNYEDLTRQAGVPSDTTSARKGGERSWILPLVDEIVQRNCGSMKLSEGGLRMVSLRLPIERRKLVYYEPTLA